MEVSKNTNGRHEIELKYDPEAEPIADKGKVGHYIGSGYGSIKGERLNGKLHFTLYESQGDGLCQSNLFGLITTKDGAEIAFDSMGIFKVPDSEQYHKWITTAGVDFKTSDERYAWLNTSLGTWNGVFDMKSNEHKYQLQITG